MSWLGFGRRAAAATAVVVALTGGVAGAAPQHELDVRLIGLNDLHGNLEPPAGTSGLVTLHDGSTVPAGGAAYLATHVRQLRADHPNNLVISGGDNTGASPLASALFHDEPSIDFLNSLGLASSVVGNHELQDGYQELLRKQYGGCSPVDGCKFDTKFSGANFPYIAGNMTYHGLPAVAPFTVKFVQGVPIGIIGATVQDMASLVSADALKGLAFSDEAAAINRSADLLDRLGVHALVADFHQGDYTKGGGPNDCSIEQGAGTKIANALSQKIDVIFSAHTHQQYNCVLRDPAGNPRPYIQGSSFGRLLSVVDVKIDKATGDVERDKTVAQNDIVTRDVAPDLATQALVERAVKESAPIANRKVGQVAKDITNQQNAAGESALGDVVADAQLESDKDTQLVLMTPDGIRADLTYKSSPVGEGDGVVTYGEAFATQPFADVLQTVTLTGIQLKAALEQQWQQQAGGSVFHETLQTSSTLHYSWSASAPIGSKISDMAISGKAVGPDDKIRVGLNNFLTAGGDGFTTLKDGTDLVTGTSDVDALAAYLTAHQPLSPPPADRITMK